MSTPGGRIYPVLVIVSGSWIGLPAASDLGRLGHYKPIGEAQIQLLPEAPSASPLGVWLSLGCAGSAGSS